MTQAAQLTLDAHFGAARRADADLPRVLSPSLFGDIELSVHDDMAALEQDWRALEAHADCTVFQTFDWLATWQHHVGLRNGVTPAIVVGRTAAGTIEFLLPLAIRPAGFARELTWLGSDLCDYNAPLLAGNFDPALFAELWRKITQRLQSDPRFRFDYINFTKMPERVGAQSNPFTQLGVTINPNGAYLTHLTGDWESFYNAKRSSSSRKRDRAKRKKLSECGDIRLFNAESQYDIARTLATLIDQKTRSFVRMGVANLFVRPGYSEFFGAVACDPALAHLSTLNVGTMPAASNLGLAFRGRYYHLLASYDDGEVSRFGPGGVHLQELMHQAIDRGFSIFDFTIGDELYKRDWSDTELKLYDFVAASTWRGALFAGPMLAKQRLKRWIKQTPAVWKAFSAVRVALGAVSRFAGR
jgi:CelD/BcsL family acetyltransferase involved in cellulose biosynthesis